MITPLHFFILSGAAFAGIGALGWNVWRLRRKIHALTRAADTPQHIVATIAQRLVEAETSLETMEPRIKFLETASRTSIQKIGFTRFNPFQNTGGDNSFVVSLLDQKDSGVILSSLYTRDGVRVYGKTVEQGLSKYPLSDEEKRVLKETIAKKNQES